MSSGPTGTINCRYDESGNRTARRIPNGSSGETTVFTARYNHNQQPIESVTQTGAGPGSSYYLYDAQNRLSRQVEGADGSTPVCKVLTPDQGRRSLKA